MSEPQTIEITVTEQVTSVYAVTVEELEELDLPTTVEQITESDVDDVAVSLLDVGPEPVEYSVTEREVSARRKKGVR